LLFARVLILWLGIRIPSVGLVAADEALFAKGTVLIVGHFVAAFARERMVVYSWRVTDLVSRESVISLRLPVD
jgi:hypothetical protein